MEGVHGGSDPFALWVPSSDPGLPPPATNTSGGLPHAVAVAGGALLSLSSTLSIFGDVGIMLGFLFSLETRRHPTLRLIFFLAVADLLGEMPVVGSMSLPGPPVYEWGGETWGHRWCLVQAAGNWFAVLSTWCWTMAYAHLCAASISRVSFFFRRVPESVYHFLCWGLPAASVALLLAYGALGRSDDGSQQCTIHNANVAMAFCMLLWVALLYNVLVFCYVHGAMRAALSVNALAAEAEAASAMQRRLDALGGRFVLYILTFIGTQSPAVFRHILIFSFGPSVISSALPFWCTLTLLSDLLTPLHGFLNFLVYVVFSRRRDDPAASGDGLGGGCCAVCCTPCGGGGGGGGCPDAGAGDVADSFNARRGKRFCGWSAALCRRALWWRRPWRPRSRTETTIDSEDSHQSCTAPLVHSEAPSQGRGSPPRGSPTRGGGGGDASRSSPARQSGGGGGARQLGYSVP